jgi:hypothetical protein
MHELSTKLEVDTAAHARSPFSSDFVPWGRGGYVALILSAATSSVQNRNGRSTFCEAELRLRSQLRVPFWPQAGDFCTHEQDPGKNELCNSFFRILFWPRLEPLDWILFESRRAAGVKNQLPQAVRCKNK